MAIIFVVAVAIGTVAALKGNTDHLILMVATVSLAGVSFWDDWRGVPVEWRFACHSIVAIMAISTFGWPNLNITLGGSLEWILPSWVSVCVSFLWFVGYTNAFNFMDGINGIAGAQTLIVALGSGCLAGLAAGRWSDPPVMIAFILAGSVAGFLPHNFPRARMFMGDVGSAPLGFLLAAVALWIAKTTGWWLLIPLALLHANFVLDTSITLCRRILHGERWYAPHREHFYQRLVRAGKSHTFVTLLEMGLQVIVLLLMVAYLYVGAGVRLGLIFSVIAVWLAFFCYCEMQFRRFCARQDRDSRAGS